MCLVFFAISHVFFRLSENAVFTTRVFAPFGHVFLRIRNFVFEVCIYSGEA